MKIPPANVREGQAFFLNYLEMRCEVFDASDGNGGAVLYNNEVFEEGPAAKAGRGQGELTKWGCWRLTHLIPKLLETSPSKV